MKHYLKSQVQFITILLLLVALFSCGKDKSPVTEYELHSSYTSSTENVKVIQKLLLYRTIYHGYTQSETYDYNQWGDISIKISETINGNVHKTEFIYDDNKSLIKEVTTNSEGNIIYLIENVYDENENIIEKKEQHLTYNTKITTIFSYDDKNRLIEERVNKSKEIYSYNQDGSYTVTKNATGEVSYYDKDGKLTEIVFYNPRMSNFDRELYMYDEKGDLLEVKGYKNNEIKLYKKYIYDSNGKFLEINTYENDKFKYKMIKEYDEHGNVLKIKYVYSDGIESIVQEMEYKLFPVTETDDN